MTEFFDFAEQNKFALFPCAQGTKRPILKWKSGSTHDRAQWVAWQSEHNNLAIDCAKSEILMIDVDSSKVTREEAWGAYGALCESWALTDLAMPMTQSARGGWHIPFRRPANLAATDLRGGGTLVKISDIRPLANGEEDGEVVGFKNRGYCVAPGSNLSSATGCLPYMLMTDAAAPHEAPEGLLDAIRLKTIEATCSGQTGASDKADVAKLVAELDMHGEFSTEPDWWKYMGAIKLALGDTDEGVEVALQMTTDDATSEAFWSRWKRLASVDDGSRDKCRINSMIHRYKELTGKQFNVRTSAAVMFNGVAEFAVAAGGPGMPTVASPPRAPAANAIPVPKTQEELASDAEATMDALPDLFKSSGEFADEYVAPDYLVDGIFQCGFLYSITAQTGGGKTAKALRLIAHIATGQPFCGHDVETGQVLYMAGENSTDVQQRWIGQCMEMALDPKALDVHFTSRPKKLTELIPRLEREVARKHLKPVAIVVDTAAAHFSGENENDNNENGEYARQLRTLCDLPGKPCVVVLCHPTKNAKDVSEMVPRGGGAFLNEVDGNIGLVRNGTTITAVAIGKFRGSEFAPLNFALKTIADHPRLKTTRGKQIPTVVAVPISYDEVQRLDETSRKNEDKVLELLCNNSKGMKQVDIAKTLSWYANKAKRALETLKDEKLVGSTRGFWTATEKGQKHLNNTAAAVSTAASQSPAPPPGFAPMPPPRQ